jgi:hypothetical protein
VRKPEPFEKKPEALDRFQQLISQACLLKGSYIQQCLTDRTEDILEYQLLVVPIPYSPFVNYKTMREVSEAANKYWCCLRYPTHVAAICEVSSPTHAAQSLNSHEPTQQIKDLSRKADSRLLLIPGMLPELQGLARVLRLKPLAPYSIPGKKALVSGVHSAILSALIKTHTFDPFDL